MSGFAALEFKVQFKFGAVEFEDEFPTLRPEILNPSLNPPKVGKRMAQTPIRGYYSR